MPAAGFGIVFELGVCTNIAGVTSPAPDGGAGGKTNVLAEGEADERGEEEGAELEGVIELAATPSEDTRHCL